MKKGLRILSILLLSALCLTGCGKEKPADGITIDNNEVSDIATETMYTYDNSEIIVSLKNNSENDYKALVVQITYYDDKKNEIETSEEIVTNLKGNEETYVNFDLPFNDDFEPFVPTSTKINIIKDREDINSLEDTSSYVDQIEVGTSVEDNILVVTYLNNSGETLDEISGEIVFFKDGKPIAIRDTSAFLIEETETDEIYIPYVENTEIDETDEDYEESVNIDYDEAKFYLNYIGLVGEEEIPENVGN